MAEPIPNEKRQKYRAGRKETAVTVYTVNRESKYLLVTNVADFASRDEVLKLFALYGPIEQYRILDDYEDAEEFTDVYWIKFKEITNARYAKRKLDDSNFLGRLIRVTYAPEYEDIADTREKLETRRREIMDRVNAAQRRLARERSIQQAQQQQKQQLESSQQQSVEQNQYQQYPYPYPSYPAYHHHASVVPPPVPSSHVPYYPSTYDPYSYYYQQQHEYNFNHSAYSFSHPPPPPPPPPGMPSPYGPSGYTPSPPTHPSPQRQPPTPLHSAAAVTASATPATGVLPGGATPLERPHKPAPTTTTTTTTTAALKRHIDKVLPAIGGPTAVGASKATSIGVEYGPPKPSQSQSTVGTEIPHLSDTVLAVREKLRKSSSAAAILASATATPASQQQGQGRKRLPTTTMTSSSSVTTAAQQQGQQQITREESHRQQQQKAALQPSSNVTAVAADGTTGKERKRRRI